MTLAEWAGRVERREVRVGIIGLGYVGLPLALLFCDERFPVVGFDVDAEKVEKLQRGESYIHRIAPGEIGEARRRGFCATGDFARVAEVDAVLICVPTPLDEQHKPDVGYIRRTVEAIAPHLRAGQMVVLESTTYPGTTEEIVVETIERLGSVRVLRTGQVGRGGSGCGPPATMGGPSSSISEAKLEATGRQMDSGGVWVAFSPEREDPGNTVVPRREIPKVVGGVSREATEAACALYGAVFTRTVAMSSPKAAEMTKLLENIYRCVNIALVNEMKQMCVPMGIDIWEVIDAAKTKPFGFQAFYPGPGVGGHCIPVDPFYLSWKAEQMGFAANFIELAGEVNESMPRYVVEAVAAALRRQWSVASGHGSEVQGPAGSAQWGKDAGLAGASVLVLGVAYKRDVDDLRESPALVVIDLLRRAGAKVEYNDPYFPVVGRGRRYDLQMRSTPLDALGRFDCVVIVTDHTSYDYAAIVAQSRLVVDSRNATRGIDSPKIVRC
jgi:UDP-N-acetyl-D-glucosamine dehydrogenase